MRMLFKQFKMDLWLLVRDTITGWWLTTVCKRPEVTLHYIRESSKEGNE